MNFVVLRSLADHLPEVLRRFAVDLLEVLPALQRCGIGSVRLGVVETKVLVVNHALDEAKVEQHLAQSGKWQVAKDHGESSPDLLLGLSQVVCSDQTYSIVLSLRPAVQSR